MSPTADTSPVLVPLNAHGKPMGFARVDQEDLDGLIARGITNDWFLSRDQCRVLVKPPVGKVSPVDLLIMRPSTNQKVVYMDGDPTNLTRANLAFAPRPIIDILIERDRKRHRKL